MNNGKILLNIIAVVIFTVGFLATNYDLNFVEAYKIIKMPMNYEKHYIAHYSKKRKVVKKGIYLLHEWYDDAGVLTQADYLNRLTKMNMKTEYFWRDGYRNISYFRMFWLKKTERFYPDGKPQKIEDYIRLEHKSYLPDGRLYMESGLKWYRPKPVMDQYFPDRQITYYYEGIEGGPIVKEIKTFNDDGTITAVVYHLNGTVKEIGNEVQVLKDGIPFRFLRIGVWQFRNEEGMLWKELAYKDELIHTEKLYDKGKVVSNRVLNHIQ